MKDYKKLWEQLWEWLGEDNSAMLAAYEIQGKMSELESAKTKPKDGEMKP